MHTHYDAQLTWDPAASPSVAFGVTSIVVGNCGFSLAPAPPQARDVILGDLAMVEGIPVEVLQAGVRWEFESFAEYLAFLRTRGTVPNVAAFVGHSTVRSAVMGEAASRRKATPQEIEAMCEIVREAIEAGAAGFASTQSIRHVGHNGAAGSLQVMPSRLAGDDEFRALVGVLGEKGRGVYMMSGSPQTSETFLEELAATTGRPVLWSAALHSPSQPMKAARMVEFCSEARRRGRTIYAQTACLPLVHDFSLENPVLFEGYPVWAPLRGEGAAKTLAALGDAAFRARFRAEIEEKAPGRVFTGNWHEMVLSQAALQKNRSLEGRTVAHIAKERGTDPLDAFCELGIEEGLRTTFTSVLLNSDEAAVAGLLVHESGIITLSDAGAHIAFLCDAGFGLHLFGHWVRERGLFSLEEAVRRVTSVPAGIFGFEGRGRIEPGAHADLILFDPDKVGMSGTRRVADLPGGGVQRAA